MFCIDLHLITLKESCCMFIVLLIGQARAGVREIHFLPFNPVDKRTALTYIDENGNWHRASKGAPEQVTWFILCCHMIQIFTK